MAKSDIDPLTGVETTGHSWDGIKELDNPLPKWWVGTYLITIFFSVIYIWLYPSIPTANDATDGSLGYSQRQVVEEQMAAAREAQGVYLEQIVSKPFDEILADSQLVQIATRGGQAAYNTNCAGCHGVGGGGQAGGYPVLADDVWLWGGEVETIHETIQWGVRNGSDDARYSEMPAFGADGILTNAEIASVADYVFSLSATPASGTEGETLYLDNCAACHGEAGEGVTDLGAPALNDFVWLYGGTKEEIIAQVKRPKLGVMPGFGGRLDEATLKMLAVYVHELGGGQ